MGGLILRLYTLLWRRCRTTHAGRRLARELASIYFASSAAHNLLPAPAGEVLRTVQLKRRHGYAVGALVAAQLVEKVIDALGLGLGTLVVASLGRAAARARRVDVRLRRARRRRRAGGAGHRLALAARPTRPTPTPTGCRCAAAARVHAGNFFRRLGEGMHQLRSPSVWARALGWSIMSDVANAITVGLCLMAVGVSLPLAAWFLVMLVARAAGLRAVDAGSVRRAGGRRRRGARPGRRRSQPRARGGAAAPPGALRAGHARRARRAASGSGCRGRSSRDAATEKPRASVRRRGSSPRTSRSPSATTCGSSARCCVADVRVARLRLAARAAHRHGRAAARRAPGGRWRCAASPGGRRARPTWSCSSTRRRRRPTTASPRRCARARRRWCRRPSPRCSGSPTPRCPSSPRKQQVALRRQTQELDDAESLLDRIIAKRGQPGVRRSRGRSRRGAEEAARQARTRGCRSPRARRRATSRATINGRALPRRHAVAAARRPGHARARDDAKRRVEEAVHARRAGDVRSADARRLHRRHRAGASTSRTASATT